jgi:hypothetical protein
VDIHLSIEPLSDRSTELSKYTPVESPLSYLFFSSLLCPEILLATFVFMQCGE